MNHADELHQDEPEDEPEDHEDHDHDHGGPLDELVTVRDWLRYAVSRFNRAGLFFGHGSTDAYDEAAYLILHTLALPPDRLEAFLDACITSGERPALLEVIERRAEERIPAAYLTHEAWMGDYRFYVDERVIVPRSYFGELLEDSLAPWLADPEQVGTALDLCTGSGCLAVLMAHAFPEAHITAADLSEDALAVARHNVEDYRLQDRVELIRSDLFSDLGQRRFDLIISNPPYVTAEAMAAIPTEYRHEPELALAAGEDGLDVVRRILGGAKQHLNPGGLLAVEVGHNRDLVEAAFPDLPFTWLASRSDEGKVFLLDEEHLPHP
jgi:ribosomal protein L3 glutamine methyltransferase